MLQTGSRCGKSTEVQNIFLSYPILQRRCNDRLTIEFADRQVAIVRQVAVAVPTPVLAFIGRNHLHTAGSKAFSRVARLVDGFLDPPKDGRFIGCR